jgi:hypothetical protein
LSPPRLRGPQIQKRANERLRELEYLAIEALARKLEPPSPNNLYLAALRAGTVLNAAKTVLDRTEKLKLKGKLRSTGCSRMADVAPYLVAVRGFEPRSRG